MQVYWENASAVRMIASRKNGWKDPEGRENVLLVINGSSTWMVASFTKKKLYSKFIEATWDFLNANTQKDSEKGVRRKRENLRNWFGGWETQRELYSLDLHHRRTIVLRNEFEMVPRRFALALEFRDVRSQLVEIDFRGSRYCTNLKAKRRWRCRENYSNCLQNTIYTEEINIVYNLSERDTKVCSPFYFIFSIKINVLYKGSHIFIVGILYSRKLWKIQLQYILFLF